MVFLNAEHNYTQVPDLDKFHMHTHETYELYCFLSGDAKYFVEGTIYTLKSGDIVIMKKSEAHTLLIKSCIPYERIFINFNADAILGDRGILDFIDNRPLGSNNRYPASVFKETHWYYYLKKICSAKNIHEKQAYLTVLLIELRDNYPKICENTPPEKDNIIEMIDYINMHLTENLSLDFLCNHFYISKVQINRKFKQMTGSTVWQYILAKRLLLAKELLQSGRHPTDVSVECGFHDYCSFFRAYKSKFNACPKEYYVKKATHSLHRAEEKESD